MSDLEQTAIERLKAASDMSLRLFEKPLTECFVPVIRCKNCANGMVSDNNEYIICCRLGVLMGFDDFCSYGKRKDGGAE